MSNDRSPAEAEFVKAVQDTAEANEIVYLENGFMAGSAFILDVIHNNGYSIVDKDGNRVNPPERSLAMGLWYELAVKQNKA